MKKCCLLFLVLCPFLVHAQVDTRAQLKISGRVNELSVSPEGKIWLVTAVGKSYYADSIQALWHEEEPFKHTDSNGDDFFDAPNLERVSFFDEKRAIITGYISATKYGENDSYYLTANGGKSWKLQSFGQGEWIYDVCVVTGGKAWMGGSSGNILYTDDYGVTWKKRPSPFNNSTRMHTIHMINENEGIAGALHNGIYSTTTNWRNHTKIATPVDQKKYGEGDAQVEDNRIEKIRYWQNYIVVNQSGNVFYTERDAISWKKLPVNVFDFEVNAQNNELYVIDTQKDVYLFKSPTDYTQLAGATIDYTPIDIKVVENNLYVLDAADNVYRISPTSFYKAGLFTTDYPIDLSEATTIKGTNLSWGADGNMLYLKENNGAFFRINTLNTYVHKLSLLDDSTAVFWDGLSNYQYNLRTQSYNKIVPANPLNDFLKAPLASFTISSGSQGCFHRRQQLITYVPEKDSTFTSKAIINTGYMEDDADEKNYKNTADASLYQILYAINNSPAQMPVMADFKITEKDKKEYLEKAKDWCDDVYGKRADLDKYKSMKDYFDTISPATLTAFLNQREGGWSTTTNWFNVVLVNTNSDTLFVTNTHYFNKPWGLPWTIEYKGMVFCSFNLAFSQYIAQCVPGKFMGGKDLTNAVFMQLLAGYIIDRQRFEDK